tara:strand:- start:15183 stop:15338 length:156 start_codon:yes stop_codon:yes gene_type:complete
MEPEEGNVTFFLEPRNSIDTLFLSVGQRIQARRGRFRHFSPVRANHNSKEI